MQKGFVKSPLTKPNRTFYEVKLTDEYIFMKNTINGVIAGVIATMLLSLLMMMKGKMGVMPGLDIISMLAGMMGGALALGWTMHFMVGAGYGILFGAANNKLPAKSLVGKGVILGIAGWLLMMLALMPMMGAGLFAMNMGPMAAMMTFVLHAIFGAVLGFVYSKLPGTKG
jgi:hypothetical protein